MRLFLIQAKVIIRVPHISGPFEKNVAKLVRANSAPEARSKYENHVRQLFANYHTDNYEFEYLVVADEI